MSGLVSLDVIDVASPCTAAWEQMTGDHRVRHCSQCRLNVYNLSEMGRDDALKLIEQREGRLCVRFYRRADGTVITRDCPVGLRALRRRLARVLATMAAMVTFVLAGGVWAKTESKSASPAVGGPINRLVQWLEPPEPPIHMGQTLLMMGDIALPPTAQTGIVPPTPGATGTASP